MSKRVLRLATVSMLVMILALPVSAKIVPTETEVTVDGTTVTLTVKSEGDGGPGDDLYGMFAMYPAAALDQTGRPESGAIGIPIGVRRVAANTYQGTTEVPESGLWAVVPLPEEADIPIDIFPTTPFTVPEPGIAGTGLAMLAGLGVLVIGVLVWGIAFRHRAPAWAMFGKPGASRP